MTDPVPDATKSADTVKSNDGKPKARKRFVMKTPKQPQFEGACDALKGNVFDCPNSKARQVDEYMKTKEALQVYVGQLYGPVVAKAVEKLKSPTMEIPALPKDDASDLEKKMWDRKYDLHIKYEQRVNEDLQKTYALIWGQCSDIMRTRLQEMKNYEDTDDKMDTIALLKMIQNVSFNFRTHEQHIFGIRKSIYQFNRITQGRGQSVQEYLDTFQNLVEVLNTVGVNVGHYDGVVDPELTEMGETAQTATSEELTKAKETGRQRYLEMSFLLGADRNRFGGLIEDLQNDFLMGSDRFPKPVTECFALLNHWSRDPRNAPAQGDHINTGVAFTNYGTTEEKDDENMALNTNGNLKGRAPADYNGPKCTRCGRKSHGLEHCEAKTHLNGTMLLVIGSHEAEDCDVVFGQSENEVEIKSKSSPVPRDWVLLDNQSTVDLFCNPDLLEQIYESNQSLNIRCNAGVTKTSYRGYIPGYGEVWFDPNGIANILSLSRVKEHFRVTYDSSKGNSFGVHREDGQVLTFQQSERGLFYIDGPTLIGKEPSECVSTWTAQDDSECDSEDEVYLEDDVALVNAVAANKNNYSNADYLRAKLARKLQVIMGRASTRDYLNMIKERKILNCPVNTRDITVAENIFGTDVGSLRGKTVRRTPNHVVAGDTPIPVEVMQQYGDVVTCVDVMRVNAIPFLISVSRHIRFGTAERLIDLKSSTLFKAIKKIQAIYQRRGFLVKYVHGDGEFEPMRGDLATVGIQLNVVARDEHVPEAERYIRTIKERTRSVYNMLPFRFFPPVLVTEMVYHSVYWLNMFPRRGVPHGNSPAHLDVGRELDYNIHCKIEFGAYVQTHEEHNNSMTPRTTGAIALRPTGNTQGGYFFLSLSTGRRIIRRAWTELPMPTQVIDQIHRMARRAKANRHDIQFMYDAGVLVPDDDEPEDEDDDSNYESDAESDDDESDHDDSSEDDDDDDWDPDVDGEVPSDLDTADSDAGSEQSDHGADPEEFTADNRHDDEITGVDDEQESAGPPEPEATITGVRHDPANAGLTGVVEDESEHDPIEQLDMHAGDILANGPGEFPEETIEFGSEFGSDSEGRNNTGEEPIRNYGNMNMRPRPRKNYRAIHRGENFLTIGEIREVNDDGVILAIVDFRTDDNDDIRWMEEVYHCNNEKEGIALVTEQMHWRKGLKVFQDRGEDAMTGELSQVHYMDGFIPRFKDELTTAQKKRALKYLMYLKEKRCGRIKARGCADGRKQRLWMNKNETSSPTVALGALILSCVIDAQEDRKVATCDIPGAFLQTSMAGEEVVHVVLEGRMAELLAKIDPSLYEKYLVKEGGVSHMYVELNKALYGTLKAALLFWMDLSKTLEEDGFVVNPYDWCVANKVVNGKQCTVVWHVDDLKISHVDQAVVDSVINMLNDKYGKVSPVTVNRGNKHDYLGMELEFKGDGTVDIGMKSYIESILEEAPTDMEGTVNTPAAEHLFQVNEKAAKLATHDADFFHHMVAKLLFVCKRGRPDIQTAIAFLCTRVQAPDVDDYKKLGPVVRYLRNTRELVLSLSADNLNQPQWWIGGSYATHPDMRSHTGVHFSLGRGTMHGLSTKQKLNTKSSTEAELVAVDDAMGQVLWTQYFFGGSRL